MELIKHASKEKLRGGFYTPPGIADFIIKWAFNGHTTYDILEPSCGDGNFLKQIKAGNYNYNSLLAIELDKAEAKKAGKLNLINAEVKNKEFHKFCNTTKKRFDLILGNPPYIRYQYFNKEQQNEASHIFKEAGLKYTKLTNAWVSFVVGAGLLLKEKGKIGFVLPAEILQVSFAKTLRKHIASYYNKINIISFQKLVFPDIQQEVVLLLCEKDQSRNHKIEHLEVRNVEGLQKLDVSRLKAPKKQIDFKSNKWTFYFLDQKEIDFIEEITRNSSFKKLEDYAKVEVGITTGANPFFTVPLSLINEYDLEEFSRPVVGRSVQAESVIFTQKDWKQNRLKEARAHLLVFPPIKELAEYPGALKYIARGEKDGINKGYKCGIREEWQRVPSLWIPDAFFVRRNNIYPKFILNRAKAYSTDTMHRVKINKNIDKNALAASYYNSLSLAFTEICGRSHGGGVLEMMPNEVENIILPYNKNNKELLPEIDKQLRKKEKIEKILEWTNNKILKENLGFSQKDIQLIHNIWQKLSTRRLRRGNKK